MYLYSAYGTICGLVLLIISAAGCMAGVVVYNRCKRKGKEIASVLRCSLGRTRSMQIELKQFLADYSMHGLKTRPNFNFFLATGTAY